MNAWDTFSKAVPENVNDKIKMKGSHGIGASSLGLLDSSHLIFEVSLVCASINPSDICIALAAIAEKIHGLGFVQSDYMVYLRAQNRQDHRYQILWSAILNQRIDRGHDKGSYIYLAPTWSWSPVNYPVNVPSRPGLSCTALIFCRSVGQCWLPVTLLVPF